MKRIFNESATTSHMRTVQLESQSCRPKLRKIGNSDYQVFPVVLLVEGVHQGIGSEPVYYSDSVLEATAALWNNVPVTIGHPINQQGEHILVNHDGTIAQQWAVGHVINVRWENGKLRGEIWLNSARVQTLAPGLIEFLKNGGQLEVSTGLLAAEDRVAGSWNEESYASSVLEIIPDHLALLPGATGACSWEDGCGVRWNVRKEAHLIVHVGVDLQQTVEKVRTKVDSMDEYDSSSETWKKMHFVRAVYSDHFIYHKKERTGQQVTETLFRQGYSLDTAGQVVLEGEPEEVVEDIQYKRKANEQGGDPTEKTTIKEEKNMKKKVCCEKRIDALIANANTAFTEEDREWLTSMNEQQLDKIEANVEVEEETTTQTTTATQKTNQTAEPAKDITVEGFLLSAPPEIRSVLNDGLRQLDLKRADLITRITANERNKFSEQDLKNMDTNMLENLAQLLPEPVSTSVDFSGRVPGMIQTNASDQEEEPYVAQTLGSVLGKK